MGTETTQFNSNLVRSYITFLRGEGQKYVPSPLLSQAERMSTPLLSWIYFNRNNPRNIATLVDQDRKRADHIIGSYLIEEKESLPDQDREEIYFEAMRDIELVWPEMHQLIKTIGPIISFPSSDHVFESASDPKIFGEIIYRMDSQCPVKWGEILVHEIGHHYLYVITSTKKNGEVFNRPFKDIRFSNLKNERRPLIGIYHAVFAQSCMITYASKVLQSDLSEEKKLKSKAILERFKEIFPKDLETIIEADLLDFDEHIKKFIKEAKDHFSSYFDLEIKL